MGGMLANLSICNMSKRICKQKGAVEAKAKRKKEKRMLSFASHEDEEELDVKKKPKVDDSDLLVRFTSEGKEEAETQVEANQARDVKEWIPSRLLCKRLNI